MDVAAVNATTREWRVDPLPPDSYITQGQSTTIGNISTVSFIYMLMSLLIVLLMLWPSIDWIGLVVQQKHPYKPPDKILSTLPPHAFRRRLSQLYPSNIRNPLLLDCFAETVPRPLGEKVTPQDLRECRELIRAKFALDVNIHNHRNAVHSRQPVEEMKRKSVGALGDIKMAVERWVERGKGEWSKEEWKIVKEIHRRLKPLLEKEPEFDGDMRRSEESSEVDEDETDDEPQYETTRPNPPTAGRPTISNPIGNLPTANPTAVGPFTVSPFVASPYPRPPLPTRSTTITEKLQTIFAKAPTNPDRTEIPELPTSTPFRPPRRGSIMNRFHTVFTRTPMARDGIEFAELPTPPPPGPFELG
ncbi:MAG: hypothetical protein M1840_007891 [Geoglossum simile]|nr:MAG: hypothetical protein M1840_007891 [Geoglossum simile]